MTDPACAGRLPEGLPAALRLVPQSRVAGLRDRDGPQRQERYGWRATVAEVMAVVRRDARYFVASGGGLTVSGGEPTAQYAFCAALLGAARAEGIHTCLDTCGALDWPRLDALRALVDVFLYDFKATGRDRHLALTGIEPDLPLSNLTLLLETGASLRLRCPVVPGVNDAPVASLGQWRSAAGGPGSADRPMPCPRPARASQTTSAGPAPLFPHVPTRLRTAAARPRCARARQAALGRPGPRRPGPATRGPPTKKLLRKKPD